MENWIWWLPALLAVPIACGGADRVLTQAGWNRGGALLLIAALLTAGILPPANLIGEWLCPVLLVLIAGVGTQTVVGKRIVSIPAITVSLILAIAASAWGSLYPYAHAEPIIGIAVACTAYSVALQPSHVLPAALGGVAAWHTVTAITGQTDITVCTRIALWTIVACAIVARIPVTQKKELLWLKLPQYNPIASARNSASNRVTNSSASMIIR